MSVQSSPISFQIHLKLTLGVLSETLILCEVRNEAKETVENQPHSTKERIGCLWGKSGTCNKYNKQLSAFRLLTVTRGFRNQKMTEE
jgi:hypothetical protein